MKAKIPPTSPKYKVKELEKLYQKDSLSRINQPDRKLRKELIYTILVTLIIGLLSGFLGSIIHVFLGFKYPETFSFNRNSNSVVIPSREEIRIKYDNIYQTVSPAIVDIYPQKEKTEDSLEGIYLPSEKAGSGLIISSDGFIATTDRVIEAGEAYAVITKDGDSYLVEEAYDDPSTNLVFLKIKAEGLNVAQTVSREDISLGETAFVMANNYVSSPSFLVSEIEQIYYQPFEEKNDFVQSSERLNSYLTINKDLNQKWEGEPLVYKNGKIAGIYTYRDNKKNLFIPADYLKGVVNSLIEDNEVIRLNLGINYLDLKRVLNISSDLSQGRKNGLLIWNDKDEAVIKHSPADKAGLQKYDIIIEIDGQRIELVRDFSEKIQSYSLGEVIDLKVIRAGVEKEVKVTLEKLAK